MGVGKACYWVTESSLPLAAVSATGRRSICRTPIVISPFPHGRYCNE
ncbi:MAG: hypothetical protein IJR07_02970 [Bacteroidaceae bacterium]|nr:hypothetical protein [Bacteroidaceae bacterium]